MRTEGALAMIVTALILVVGAVVIWSLMLRYRRRELQHKERLAALEKGMQLPESIGAPPEWSARPYLLKGMMWLFGGIALAVFLAGISMSMDRPPSVEERLRRARNLRNMGASEEEIRRVENDPTPQDRMTEAMALLGLVPIGVGLAYLIYYRVESKNAQPPR